MENTNLDIEQLSFKQDFITKKKVKFVFELKRVDSSRIFHCFDKQCQIHIKLDLSLVA